MRFHSFSLSPSCFVNNFSLEATIKILSLLFHNALLFNHQDLFGKTIRSSIVNLDHNRVKDLELLLLMYHKEKRIVEVLEGEEFDFNSLCELNIFLFKQGINILFSNESLTSDETTTCGNSCFMSKESKKDIYEYVEDFPIPPSQETRLGMHHDIEVVKRNIYCPQFVGTPILRIVDPFIGRELFNLVELNTDSWKTESHWIYSLTEIFNLFKEHSIFKLKNFLIYTAVRIDEEEKALESALRFKKHFLTSAEVDVKFFFYIYERAFNPPDEFPHDRYLLTNNVGVNIGIGLDTFDPENNRARRETQVTLVGNETVASVLSQLRNLPIGTIQGKKSRILRREVIK
ncbi:MAG: hypothetical protein ACFFDC_17515 [Promethearchaeota archaeon]